MRTLCQLVVACVVLASWALTSVVEAAEERVRLSVLMHAFRCVRESDWDRGTDSDEPYLMVVGFKHPDGQSWRMGVHVFNDVDRGEWRNLPRSVGAVIPPPRPPAPTLVGPGGVAVPLTEAAYVELRPGESVGFQVRMMEQDGGTVSQIEEALDQATSGIAGSLSRVPVVGDIAAGLAAVADFLSDIIMAPINLLLGSADDYIGSHTVIFYLPAAGQTGGPPGVGSRTVTYINAAMLDPGNYGIPAINPFRIDGGSEGVYDIYTNADVARVTVPDPPPPILVRPTSELRVLSAMRPQAAAPGVLSLAPFARPGMMARPVSAVAGITRDDFLGEYRLFLDGVENRLSLRVETVRPASPTVEAAPRFVGYLVDPAGTRHEVADFQVSGHRFTFKVKGFAGDPAAALTCNGYLLTQTKNAIVGTTVHRGITYGFYGVKSKFEHEPAQAAPPLPRAITPVLPK